ncbi:Os06g0281600 [Oryza sativa Japonica Group]|uniref:Os06g0281600 protein n=1 Tax=Oryza sativa subsp. japonica TaxID=39947 RepID=A0A0P0WVP4_ORYSJ|nr:Os06g0281600 [Oryza sativa Japonica Group]
MAELMRRLVAHHGCAASLVTFSGLASPTSVSSVAAIMDLDEATHDCQRRSIRGDEASGGRARRSGRRAVVDLKSFLTNGRRAERWRASAAAGCERSGDERMRQQLAGGAGN